MNDMNDARNNAKLEVVLMSPRNPLNIGAAARAMANFGVKRLTVVTPWDPSWREARSAIEAEELMVTAREAESLVEAIAEATLVLGTGTSRYRKPDQEYFLLPDVRLRVKDELARGGRVALVFGSEKHGLTREELSLCHALVEIPTDAGQPSMNLGQAVAVCLYELRQGVGEVGKPVEERPGGKVRDSAVAVGDLERLTELILEVAERVRYSPGNMREVNREDLRLMLRRWQMSPADVRRAMGLLRKVLHGIACSGGAVGAKAKAGD